MGVERRARRDEGVDVGDADADAEAAIGEALGDFDLIEVARGVVVDGGPGELAEIGDISRRGNGGGEGGELRRQLEEKEEIISELRDIIRLSNENNSRVKPRSVYLGERSPEREEELKELRHSVKVLTIENNALSGYIDKLKQQLAGGKSEGGSASTVDQLREENRGLREENEGLREENRGLR